nr:MAG TPA: Helix-turn-helix XRE-family like protein [Caudoviricetes sp.]
MNKRIKELRETLGLSQDELGKSLELTRNYISLIENGQRNMSSQSIKVMCSMYNINEEWLRTGNGEMFNSRTRNQEIGAFANEVMMLDDDNFKKKFIDALIKLDSKDWEHLEEIAKKLLSN